MTDSMPKAERFIARYAAALVDRDEKAVARLYAVPALILFPGRSIAVTEARQTEEFFASSWSQYEGVDDVEPTVTMILDTPASLWVDVTWSYAGRARERFCYQLVDTLDGPRIAVLTPLG